MLRYIGLIAFTVRILVPIVAILSTHDPSVFYDQDSSGYIDLAKALTFKSEFATDGPEIFRTPGYPVLLIPGIFLNRLELTAIVLQIAISCLTVCFVFRLARTVFEVERAADFAAILYAIEPQSILYSSKILSETLFTGLLMGFLLLFFLFTRTHKFHFLFTAGLLLSAAVYVRPIAFYLPVIVSIFIFAIPITAGKSARWSAIRGVTFLAICGLLIGAWNVRNRNRADYSGFSSVSDYNLYFYQAASVLAAESGVPYYTMRQELGAENPTVYYENHPEQRQWTRGEVSRYLRREAMRVLLRHPFLYAEIHLKGMLRMMLDPGGVEYLKLFRLYPQSGGLLGRIVDQGLTRTLLLLRQESPSVFWSTALLGTILILYWLAASAGACFAWRSYTAELSVILTLILYFVILSGGPNSLERLRHPVMPMVCLLAGYALCRASSLIRWPFEMTDQKR